MARWVYTSFRARVLPTAYSIQRPRKRLIYEPLPNGDFRLVGVEFIQLADDWAARNPNGGVPSLDGNLMNLVGCPEPLRLARLLRAARLGLGRQSERQLRGLEQPRNL